MGLSDLFAWPKIPLLLSRKRLIDVMPVCFYKKTLYLIYLFVALVGLAACSGLTQYATVEPPKLTSAEQERVGAAVEGKLLQMLGGPYHDKALAKDLNQHVRSARPLKIAVADRSRPALYPLPGGRAIISRGLLTGLRSRAELDSLLAYALRLSINVYGDRVERRMVEATEEVLTVSSRLYDPDSAEIRLARLFEQRPCEQSCLMPIRHIGETANNLATPALPESVQRLTALRPGYDLLVEAQEFERIDDHVKAIAIYLQAAATAPDEPRILGALGLAYLRVGQVQSARLHLEKAVKLQPDYYRTQMGLGYLYLQMGKYAEANQVLASSARMLPVTENLFLLAEAREKSGDLEAARSLYRLVVESDRTSKLGRTAASRLAPSAGLQ